jgi:small subunit ribosomal protein S17
VVGRVVSTKMKNTAVVLVETKKRHSVYQKSFTSTKKYLVDDSLEVKLGDIVEFNKCRPISKLKHWKITKVLGRDIVAVETEIQKEVAEEAIAEVLPEEVVEEIEEKTEDNTEDNDEVETKKAKKGKAKKA